MVTSDANLDGSFLPSDNLYLVQNRCAMPGTRRRDLAASPEARHLTYGPANGLSPPSPSRWLYTNTCRNWNFVYQ